MAQRFRTGQDIGLAVMSGLGQRLDGDRRDVSHIDEGQPGLARRQANDATGTIGEEILIEPLGPDQDMSQPGLRQLPVAQPVMRITASMRLSAWPCWKTLSSSGPAHTPCTLASAKSAPGRPLIGGARRLG
jgi:hypothetical protein